MEFLTSSICTVVKLIDEDDPDMLKVLMWVKENIDHFEHSISDQGPWLTKGHFIFFEKYDVMAFKLRWL